MNPLDRISTLLNHNIAAGIAGGLVCALVYREGRFLERIAAVPVGGIIANYATPVAIAYGGPAIAENPFFYGFLIGFGGWVIALNSLRLLTAFAKKPFIPSPTALAAFLNAYNSHKKKTDEPAE